MLNNLNNTDIKELIPSKYTDKEKDEIISLLTNLANIYIEIEEGK